MPRFVGEIIAGDGSLGGLFSDFLLRLGGPLDLSLFDGGRLRAEIRAAVVESDVLDAQRQLISSREALIDSEAALASAIIAFYTAIGGDFPREAQPAP